MNISNRPDFENGLETICRSHSFLKLIEIEGCKTPDTLYKLFHEATSPYPEMAGLIGDKVALLDPSKPEAVKVQNIWKKFNSKAQTCQALWEAKTELENWITSYKSADEVPLSMSFKQLLLDSPAVVVKGATDSSEPNAISPEEILEIPGLITVILKIIKLSDREPTFNIVKDSIFQLVFFKEGRKLIKDLIDLAGDKKISFQAGDRFLADLVKNEITVPDHRITCVYECPDRDTKGEYLLKSLRTPFAITIAHELLHILHTWKGMAQQKYPKGSHMADLYTDHEEERTIRGSANCLTSENSIGSDMNLRARYGHIAGNAENEKVASSIEHASRFGIVADLDWIIPSVKSEDSLKQLYIQQHDTLKVELTEKQYTKTRKKLKRKLEKEAKKSKRPEKVAKLKAIAHHPLSKGDIAHNRTIVLEKIQTHMLAQQFDTSSLIPASPEIDVVGPLQTYSHSELPEVKTFVFEGAQQAQMSE